MAVVNSDFLGALFTKFTGQFFTDFAAAAAVQGWTDLTTEIKSTTLRESMNWAGETAAMRDADRDEAEKQSLNTFNYTVTNKEFIGELEVLRADMEDDQLGQVEPRTKDLAQEAQAHTGRLALLQYEANPVAFSGSAWFSTTHTVGEATINNAVTVSVSSVAAPTVADIRAVIAQARLKMGQFQDAKGRIMGLTPDTIVVPPNYEAIFVEALTGSSIRGDGPQVVDPAATGMRKVGGYNLLTNWLLTGTDKVYFHHTRRSVKPMVWTNRMGPELSGPTAPSMPDGSPIRRFNYAARARKNVGIGHVAQSIRVQLT